MDFAAWMEVYLGGRWFTFDPRNNEQRKGRVLIGRGRDAGDVAMATTYGAPWLQRMTVVAEEAVPAPQPAGRPEPWGSSGSEGCPSGSADPELLDRPRSSWAVSVAVADRGAAPEEGQRLGGVEVDDGDLDGVALEASCGGRRPGSPSGASRPR